MKKLIVVIVPILLILTSCQNIIDPEADKQTIIKLNKEWDINTMKGNVEKNAALYTEDAIRIDGGKIYEGREAINNLLQSYAKGTTPLSMENKTENIWISGDIAAVRGAFKGSFIQDESGDTLNIKGAWSSVYERQADGTWKVVFSLGSPLN